MNPGVASGDTLPAPCLHKHVEYSYACLGVVNPVWESRCLGCGERQEGVTPPRRVPR